MTFSKSVIMSADVSQLEFTVVI